MGDCACCKQIPAQTKLLITKLSVSGSNPEVAVLEAVKKVNPCLWYQLGAGLAITPPDLEMIRTKNNNDQEKCLQGVVTTWREKKIRPFDLGSLNQILSSLGDYQMLTTTSSMNL